MVKVPAVLVVPVIVVGTDPPLMVMVTPETTVPAEVVTLNVSFPAVAMAMFRVEVAPDVTVVGNVLVR